MATVPKQVTTGDTKRHIPAMFIRGAQIDEESSTAYVAFSPMTGTGNDAPVNTSTTLPCTREAYRRIAKGVGSLMRSLRSGLVGLSRFNYVVVTDNKKLEDSDETREVVTHVHAYPNQNYMTADFSSELRFPVDENEAIVQLHASGDIDVMAFPGVFYLSTRRFITELEKLDQVDDMTSFSFKTQEGTVNARVMLINGNMVRFSLDLATS